MTEKMHIKIEFSESSLFGSTDPSEAGIDAKASVAGFTESLVNHIYSAYPEAEIEVSAGINDRVRVDGFDDHPEVPWVENIVDVVWNGDSWLEYL